LPCGPRPGNPAELITSSKFQDVLAQLRTSYDFVIVDTPPLLAVSEPSVVATRVDGVLLVLRMTNTSRPTAERAREQLGQLGVNILGVVVNGHEGQNSYYYSKGGSYGYQYQYQYHYQEQDEDEAGAQERVK